MPFPDPRGSPKVVLIIAALAAAFVLACDRSPPTAPSARVALPSAPSRDLDPVNGYYTPDPNDGCYVAPDSSVFRDSPQLYGGILPYTFTRCGVSTNVWWPGLPDGVHWPYTAVFPGYNTYNFPWGHYPGTCCLVGQGTGFPWTITFGKAIRNVRVYTRYVEFTGGVVNVRGAFGNLIASKPIPVRDSVTAGRDTIAFADTNVYIVEIVPNIDPRSPPDASYPEKREAIHWQAQFEPPPTTPCPPSEDEIVDNTQVRHFLRDLLDSSNVWTDVANRRERVGAIWFNDATQQFGFNYPSVDPATSTPCRAEFFPPVSPGVGFRLIVLVHTHTLRNASAAFAAEVFPSICGTRYAGRSQAGEGTPSNDDWNAAWTKRVPGIIVGPQLVTRFEADDPISRDPAFRPAMTGTWPWNMDGCRWTDMRPAP